MKEYIKSGGVYVERVKLLRRKQILMANVYIISFSIILLISILLNNRNAIALTIIIFSLPKFITEIFYQGSNPMFCRYFSFMGELKDYEKKQLGDKWNKKIFQRPVWMWAIIPIVILMLYFTDVLYYGSITHLYIVFVFSAMLIAANNGIVDHAKNVDDNAGLSSYLKKLSITSSSVGILLFLTVALIIES